MVIIHQVVYHFNFSMICTQTGFMISKNQYYCLKKKLYLVIYSVTASLECLKCQIYLLKFILEFIRQYSIEKVFIFPKGKFSKMNY